MTIVTIYVSDERYAAQRPDHVHRRCQTHKEAQDWIDNTIATLGAMRAELFDWDEGYRCPHCGWSVR
jgi:hypothetical protein